MLEASGLESPGWLGLSLWVYVFSLWLYGFLLVLWFPHTVQRLAGDFTLALCIDGRVYGGHVSALSLGLTENFSRVCNLQLAL